MATYRDGAATLASPDARLNDSDHLDAYLRELYPEFGFIRPGTSDVWRYVSAVLREVEKQIIAVSAKLQALGEYSYRWRGAEKAGLSSTLTVLKGDLSSGIARLAAKTTSCAPYLVRMEPSSLVGFSDLRAKTREWASCCPVVDDRPSIELSGINFGMQMILAQMSELLEIVTQ